MQHQDVMMHVKQLCVLARSMQGVHVHTGRLRSRGMEWHATCSSPTAESYRVVCSRVSCVASCTELLRLPRRLSNSFFRQMKSSPSPAVRCSKSWSAASVLSCSINV